MSFKKVTLYLSLIIGMVLIFFGVIPVVFAYPYSEGPNSGPSNLWELILIISYEGWLSFLIMGLVLLVLSIILIRMKKEKNAH